MPGLVDRIRTLLPNFAGTTRATLTPDIAAGFAVAAIAVPQGMAYALVAGVPIEMGLWAAALPAAIAAMFGSSPYLVTGPTQPVALVLGLSVVGPAVLAGDPVPVAAVLQIGLLAGVALAAFALMGLGRASRFLSDSVLTGIVVGVGVLIVVGQIPQIAAAPDRAGEAHAYMPQVGPMLVDAWRALGALDPRSALLAACVPLLVVALRRFDSRIPGALIALALAAGLVQGLGWNTGPGALATLAGASVAWPGLGLPPLPNPGEVGPAALAIALLVTVQSTAAARALARPGDDPVDSDRELFGQGTANIAAGLLGAIPASASFSRSALARSAGARTRLAAAVSGVLIFALLPVIGRALVYLPLAGLAGLVILAGVDLIDRTALRRAAATRGDAAVLAVTLAATLWLDVVNAIYAGLFLSLLLLVRRGGRLQMVEIVRAGEHRLREIPLDATTGTTPAVVLHLEGDLNFAVAPELAERLRAIGARGMRVLILRLKRARHLDATVLEALRRVSADLQQVGATVILCGLTDEIAELLRGSELEEVLGTEGLLRTGPRLMEGYERALERARDLLKPLSDSQIFRREKPAAWSYEI
jgi:SulP family sulfate permease